MDTFFKDISYGIRNLIKRPGFFAVAVITLALGIGANSAIFNMVNAVLLRPLSFPDSDKLVLLEALNLAYGTTDGNMSVPDLVDLQSQNQSFQQMADRKSTRLNSSHTDISRMP